MAFPLINPYQQFVDSNGDPLVSGTIEFRSPTDNSLINSYPTADDADAQTNANDNPLTLSSTGAAPVGLFLEDGVKYKVILKDAAGSTVGTWDDVRCPLYSAASLGVIIGSVLGYGATGDGVTDDRAAFVLADAAVDEIIVSGGLDYVIASSLTITKPVRIEAGSRILASSGATVTYAGGVLCHDNDWSQKFGGDGTSVISVAQNVKIDWFGAVSTSSATANGTVQKAISGTARNSTIWGKGDYATTPLDMIFDEGNQATATNRDAGKTFKSLNTPYAFRFGTQSIAYGMRFILGDGEDDDLLTMTGVRVSSQPSRSHVGFHGLVLDGNKANNSSGKGMYLVSVKDVYGEIMITSCAGHGFHADDSVNNSCNVIDFSHIVSVNNGGQGIRTGGAGDLIWPMVHVGGNTDDNIVAADSVKIGVIHSYVSGSNAFTATGNVQVGVAYLNDADDANLNITGEGASFGQVFSKNAAIDPASDNQDTHVSFSGTASNNTIGVLYTTDADVAAKRNVYFLDGSTNNSVECHKFTGSVTGNRVLYASGAENDGNIVHPGPAVKHIAYAATVTIVPAEAKLFRIAELTGNIVMANPTTLTWSDGQEFTVILEQDSGGSRTITFNSAWDLQGFTPSTTADEINVMKFIGDGLDLRLVSGSIGTAP